MTKEKQIEEMTENLCDIECKGMKCDACDCCCEYRMLAEALYNAGYRKQSEGEWIFEADEAGGTGNIQVRCSNCQAGDIHRKGLYVPYCWSCGAKMKGGE